METVNMKLQMRILETHLETKDRLIRNLEEIIDEQETRISNMEEFIQGRRDSYVGQSTILKGISVLSWDFGQLSDENLKLKQALAVAQRQIRMGTLVETDEDYESDLTSEDRFRVSPTPQKSYEEKAKQLVDGHNLKKLKRMAEELKNEKDELKRLAFDTKEAFSVCMAEVKLMLESKTMDFFQVLIARYKAEMEKRRQLHNQLVELNGNIRVFYRIRPQLGDCKETPALSIDSMDHGIVHLTTNIGKKSSHSVDRIIPTHFTQQQIFDEISPIITSCIDGYNVCIFAYGHTGSGKTYTMEGPSTDPGINQRALQQLFETVTDRDGDIDYTINVSMIEIYNEKLKDLLTPSTSTLCIRQGEDGRTSIPGLTEQNVDSLNAVTETLNRGKKNKAIAATDANKESSRSHVIVRVTVIATNRITNRATVGRLNLVDLAGSERVSQTNATGQLLNEAKAINKSLSELGNVVLALRQNNKHVPFRNCQLTRFLEDSLNGESKTLVMVHLSPDTSALTETISSMNFAEKIGQVQTKTAALQRGTPQRRSSLVQKPKSDSNSVGSPKK
ncbi:unnamed protein product, partial [Mesorhabditis belari]|uniref:Kinesin-like protein n=1 Tax=Mesorhabditis belari TaxID=2138241 RepID=A0AAF3EYL0_9BILA